jgi:hypothetical protein
LKDEALDRAMWRNRFGGGFEPVVRQNTEWMNVIEFTSKIHTSPSVFARLRSFLCVYSSYESDWSDSAAVFMSALRGRIIQAVLRAELPNWPCVFGSVCGVVGIARTDCCSVVSPHSCATRAITDCEHRRGNKSS